MRSKTWMFFFPLLFSFLGHTKPHHFGQVSVKYRSYFGECPSRVAGKLTLELLEEFEKKQSLRSVKKKIVREKLDDKNFISEYKIHFDPLKRFLTFSYDCPKPLLKAQIYKKGGRDSYTAILVETGEFYDPTYEVLLRQEDKLKKGLPSLALPIGKIDKETQQYLAFLVKKMKLHFRSRLSEMIVGQDNELTIIFSIKGRPISAFLGQDKWETKLDKLERIVQHMGKKKKIPAIINLTNAKKVVVKFSDSL